MSKKIMTREEGLEYFRKAVIRDGKKMIADFEDAVCAEMISEMTRAGKYPLTASNAAGSSTAKAFVDGRKKHWGRRYWVETYPDSAVGAKRKMNRASEWHELWHRANQPNWMYLWAERFDGDAGAVSSQDCGVKAGGDLGRPSSANAPEAKREHHVVRTADGGWAIHGPGRAREFAGYGNDARDRAEMVAADRDGRQADASFWMSMLEGEPR
jgi:hypothetical protein